VDFTRDQILVFGNAGFPLGRKTRVPGEKSSEQGENQQQTQPTNNIRLESNHIGEGQMISLLHHPCSLFWSCDLGVLLAHKSGAACNVLNHNHTLTLLSFVLLCFFAFGVGYGHFFPSAYTFLAFQVLWLWLAQTNKTTARATFFATPHATMKITLISISLNKLIPVDERSHFSLPHDRSRQAVLSGYICFFLFVFNHTQSGARREAKLIRQQHLAVQQRCVATF